MLRLKDFKEYVCTDNAEREFLYSKGIKYTFVKTDEFTVWKYIKTPQLYKALAEYQEFLRDIRNKN